MRRSSQVSPIINDGQPDKVLTTRHRPSLRGYDVTTKHITGPIAKRFMPDSYTRLLWEAFVFLVIWYNAVITPIRIFIMAGDKMPEVLISLDVMFDLIFLADTILRFFLPYIDKDSGQVVLDPETICLKYRGSVTYVNMIACMPIINIFISPYLNADQQIATSNYLNILPMIRVLHIPGQFQELKRFLQRKGPVNEPIFRLHILLFFMILFMCECGCLYFGLAVLFAGVEDVCPPSESFVDEILGNSNPLWVARDSVITDVMDSRICDERPSIDCDECPQLLFLIRGMYFLMQTIFTIGYGDAVTPSKSTVEMVLACFFMIFGICANSLMIANMTSIVASLDIVNMQFRQEMDTVSRLLTLRSVPDQLRQRVATYFAHLSRLQHGMLDEVLLGDLPPKLSAELAELHIDMLTKVPFFMKNRRTEAFISMIACELKRQIYPPQTFILYQAEMQRDLVIIKSGKADIRLMGVADAIGRLLPGDFIGDYQLLFGTKNQVGVQAADFTETLVLSFDAFKRVMNHPLNKHLGFSSVGHNAFRQSDDAGCVETVEATKELTTKFAITATAVVSGKGRGKLNDMMAETIITRKEFRILPNSRIHLVWDVFSLAAILFYAIACPIRIATYHRVNSLASSYDPLFAIEYCIDALFIVDMLLRLNVYSFSTYENGKSVVVSDRAAIRRRYLTSEKFRIDVISVLPLDLVSAATGSYHVLFRLSKLIRVVQIPQVVADLQEHLEACFNVDMNETQRSVLTALSFYILFVVWSTSWWNALRPGEHPIVSIYFIFTTICTIGFGDVVPLDFNTTCLCILIGAVGAWVNATVVGKLTSLLNDGEPSENNYEHKLNCIKRYMDRHKVPLATAQRVIEYFDYAGREQDGLNEVVILRSAIPNSIANNLLIHITQPMVTACEFFHGCESGLLRKIMVSMERVLFVANYMILTPNIPSDSMYFIKRGKVELLKENADNTLRVVCKLKSNESFAQGCLFADWTNNPFLARTATECEIWMLKRSVFFEVVRDYPQSYLLLKEISTNIDDTRRRSSQHDKLNAVEAAKRNSAMYLHPNTDFMLGWLSLVTGLTLCSLVVIPFRVAFLENHDMNWSWLFLDYGGDIVLLADSIIRAAFLAFYDESNNLVVGHHEIWNRYTQSGKLKWHLLSALPVEALVFVVPSLCPFWRLQTWSLFRLNKILRAVEVPDLMKHVESSLSKAGVKIPRNPLKVLSLMFRIFLLVHLNSCVFFGMANNNQHANLPNWLQSEGLVDPSPQCPGVAVSMSVVSQQYTAALYWAMATISTVGYGDVTANLDSMPEVLYSTIIMIVGMLFYAVVIASLTEIVSQLDVTSSLYRKKNDNVNTYAQIVCLPETMKAKIESYYEHLWTCQLGINGENLMDYVPPCLKAELISEMTRPIIMNTFFIKDCAGDVVNAIVQKLDLHTYLPGDCLFRHGERCDTLYLVYNGSVDLLTVGHIKFKTISNSCVLGESSFFMFEPHLCTAKTADVTEIFQLSMSSFLGILQEYRLVTKFKDYLSVHQSILQEAKASVEKTLQNWKSSKMVRFLDATNVKKTGKGVILPDSRFRVMWDCVSLVALLYLIISIPMQISFASVSQSIGRAIFGTDLITDIFFVIDIGCRLRKFAIVKDGHLISTPKNFGLIYRRDEFRLDLISACPLSVVAHLTGASGRVYGIVRLIQAVRVVRVGNYLHNIVDIIDTRTRFVVTTAMLRVFQIFMTIFALCHIFSCMLNFIGGIQDGSREVTWLVADGIQNESIGMRYLRSFFWSLYTITTIGYGSVLMLTIPERVFAMIVMAIGCIVCDAGLTAVLSSIVANKDKQAGMNNRRIQCSMLFMHTNNVDESLQTRILEYYAFVNVEMANINEGKILQDLSSPLACEILSYFCFRPLRECPYFDRYSDGAISNLITKLTPYVAIPGEELSTIGNWCRSIFVFQRGSIRTTDAKGMTSNIVEGCVIGHLATVAISKSDGPPTHELCLELMSIRLTRSKYGNLYVIFGAGRSRCRNSIKSKRNWMERVNMKVIQGKGENLKVEITVKESRKRLCHATIGSGNLVLSESSSTDFTSCVLLDEKGRNVGSIQLRASLRLLSEEEQVSTYELTATALTFSHLYKLDVLDEQSLAKYISNSTCSNVVDRVPISEDIVEMKEPGASDSLWEDSALLKSDTRKECFFVEWTA